LAGTSARRWSAESREEIGVTGSGAGADLDLRESGQPREAAGGAPTGGGSAAAGIVGCSIVWFPSTGPANVPPSTTGPGSLTAAAAAAWTGQSSFLPSPSVARTSRRIEMT
jgi:hypothetical protein